MGMTCNGVPANGIADIPLAPWQSHNGRIDHHLCGIERDVEAQRRDPKLLIRKTGTPVRPFAWIVQTVRGQTRRGKDYVGRYVAPGETKDIVTVCTVYASFHGNIVDALMARRSAPHERQQLTPLARSDRPGLK